jgi:hypothetical protein
MDLACIGCFFLLHVSAFAFDCRASRSSTRGKTFASASQVSNNITGTCGGAYMSFSSESYIGPYETKHAPIGPASAHAEQFLGPDSRAMVAASNKQLGFLSATSHGTWGLGWWASSAAVPLQHKLRNNELYLACASVLQGCGHLFWKMGVPLQIQKLRRTRDTACGKATSFWFVDREVIVGLVDNRFPFELFAHPPGDIGWSNRTKGREKGSSYEFD